MENPQRIVQSGKVYRQIFDAEVQLVKALEEKGPKQENTKVKDAQSREPPTNIPVVHEAKEDAGPGMLSERQLTWVEGFPNEGHVENPVLYKYFSEEQKEIHEEPESSHASKEVRGLPDVLTPAKKGSDIIERIAESRRQRHDAALEDMHQQLGLISSELEPKIQTAGEELMSHLNGNNTHIEEMMSRIADDSDLFDYTIEGLIDLWQQVASQSSVRQGCIKELDDTLSQIEGYRMEQVRETFQEYTKILEKIAHLMAPDLQRLLDKESQGINQTVLSNRRAYADLFARMMMSDIDREKHLHITWTKRLEDWKHLHVEAAMNEFKMYMESDPVLNPPNVKDVLEQMTMEQETINARRLDLVQSLREMKPPSSTKTSIYHWNETLTSISVSIDELNQQYFNRVYAEYELVCQKCLEKVENIKTDLIRLGVCTESKATQVINERCLPLVGERQTTFEKDLEKMDKELEQHNQDTLQKLKSLFKFCQGSAHVWDVHELGLARQERALQEKLDQCRHLHDNQNQDREANLDIIMDRMRQDASETALQSSLKKVLEMLTKVKDAYHKFHGDQTTIVSRYPQMVEGELQCFDKAVCKFFGVNRKHPDELEKEREESLADETGSTVSTESPRPKSQSKKRPKSRSSSRGTPEELRQDSPLPMAVSEVLSTAKGTTFYVLTVAGEHGIPPEGTTPRSDRAAATPTSTGTITPADNTAFLTEVAPPDNDKQKLPPYLEAVDVGEDLLLEIKKAIRMNFLDYLEDWTEQSKDRSDAVVAAKIEELNSELDLRLHLHTPRARRAELDVHNVRAAELVMHSERVSRHCKGINQALSDLKHRFGQMTQEHNQLSVHFREEIETLEVVFINATKSSKLVALSNQLQVQQDQYMDKIRSSLRQFRQHLDDTLQMLRESNARFIKSFRVFSDGGNFCPDEIEEFRKRLEKMSNKIDSSEGFIMADLEGMESKRLEQASKVSKEFEDRFKHHMIDLLFMEKIARWLTNTQVKVKAEVADSNTQAQRLAQYIQDLDRRIDACEKPNLDKEQVTPTQLNEFVCSILDSFHQRSVYLDCLKDPIQRPSSGTLQGNPALGARVGFTSESIPPVSRAGKQPGDDPTVGVIKNILKTQKNRLQFGPDADVDGELPAAQPQNTQLHGSSVHPSSLGHTQGHDNPDRNVKSRQSRHSDTETRSKRSSKPGTATNSSTADRQQRAVSSGPSQQHVSVMMTAAPQRSKPGKIDRKFYVFGELHEEGEESHLVGRIRRVLRESLDGLLQASELYYRQKGNRQVTRPQALQETFEDCAAVIVQKLQSYYTQADSYHNQCLQEFRSQLSHLEDLVEHIPSCLVKEFVQLAIDQSRRERDEMGQLFKEKLLVWDQQKKVNEQELRPTLGHPQLVDTLQSLCDTEEARRQEYLQGVEQHLKEQQDLAVKQGTEFVEQLATKSEQLLLQFDQLLTIDDVKKGRVPPTKLSTSELLRRKQAGLPLEEEEDVSKVVRGKKSWQGVPKTELFVPGSVERSPSNVAPSATPTPTGTRRKNKQATKREVSNMTASVTTAKNTLGHTSTVGARDRAYQEYKGHFQHVLASIDEEKARQIIAEDRWMESWTASVNKVKHLY